MDLHPEPPLEVAPNPIGRPEQRHHATGGRRFPGCRNRTSDHRQCAAELPDHFGEPAVLREVDRLITSEWDLPRDLGTTKLFTLRYTDPSKWLRSSTACSAKAPVVVVAPLEVARANKVVPRLRMHSAAFTASSLPRDLPVAGVLQNP